MREPGLFIRLKLHNKYVCNDKQGFKKRRKAVVNFSQKKLLSPDIIDIILLGKSSFYTDIQAIYPKWRKPEQAHLNFGPPFAAKTVMNMPEMGMFCRQGSRT